MTDKLANANEYILRISAGSSYDNLKLVAVNHEEFPLYVNNDHFTGWICVRVRNYNGVSPEMEKGGKKDGELHNPKPRPSSAYFKGRNRRYSIMVQGRFKQTWNGDQVLFGADSNRPLTPIPGVGIALRICKWLDPALEAEVSGSNPHMYSPIVSSMNSLAIYPANNPLLDLTEGKCIERSDCPDDLDSPTAINQSRVVYPIRENTVESLSLEKLKLDDPTTDSLLSCTEGTSEALEIRDWAFARSNVPENPVLLFPETAPGAKELAAASVYEKRKKLFGNKQKREAVVLDPAYLYCMDFYDAYFSLSNFTVKLPGFSINCFKYWDGRQPLRYVMKTRDGSTVFFVVQFELVPRSEYPDLALGEDVD
ncbi:hypothetical protein HDV03_005238 [Kappamyces sp. JEL0829]|nr:hypothetical protein HDV03_005238 [Kappamyces sp. JEL0829]